jgi:glycosyltransferase EpsE
VATIDEAIASLRDQTYRDWELIACDDGSTDGTLARLRAWQADLGGRMVLLVNPANRRLQHSLNRCLAVAGGALVARMDGDDVSVPERLERQLDVLRTSPELDLVGTHMQRFDAHGRAGIVRTPVAPDRDTLRREVPFAHATILARREVFERLGGYDEDPDVDRVEDIDLWFRFFAAGFRGANIAEPLYLVREDRAAVRRRTLRNRWNLLTVTLRGHRLLGYGPRARVRPVVAFAKAFVPTSAALWWRGWERRRWHRGADGR